MRKLALSALGAVAVFLSAGGASAAIYDWTWQPGDLGNYSDHGGRINWIQSSFNAGSQTLSWYVNFGAVPYRPDLRTQGFTLALNDGPRPMGCEGELALLYFDASQTDDPRVTVYGSNGRFDASSYFDGTADNTVDPPDRILSSLHATSSDWIFDLKNQREADGTRTLGFTIDTSEILGHDPLYTQDGVDWVGACYDEQIGVKMRTFAGLQTQYRSNGYLKSWSRAKEGWLDLSYRPTITDPVPEPTSVLLLGSGIGLIALLRRRKRLF